MYVHLSAVSVSPEESVRSPGAGDTGGREPLGVGAWIAVGISTGAVSAFNLWAIPQKTSPFLSRMHWFGYWFSEQKRTENYSNPFNIDTPISAIPQLCLS